MAKVWHYIDQANVDEFAQWASGLEKRQRIKLQAKIDMLQRYGSELPPQLLSETGEAHIKKLKVHGNVQLRPLLCRLTDNNAEDEEFVLLKGAFEIQSDYVPVDALSIAAAYRQDLLKDETRKREHVRII